MNAMHRNAPHHLPLLPRLRTLGVGLGLVGLGLWSGSAWAADGPSAGTRAASPDTAESKQRASRRGLDEAARRALRASSSSSGSDPAPETTPPSVERVAMRTAAPAEPGDDPPKRGKSKKKATKGDDDARAPSDEDSRKISLDEDFLVEGKLEKPNAFYILRRSQSGYDWARLDAKFLPLVLESVQDPLF